MLLLSLMACGPSSPAGDTGEASIPSTYLYQDTGEVPPSITPEGAVSAVNSVLGVAFHYNADVLFNAYDEVMAYADPACPSTDSSDEGGSLWDVNCTSDAGASYTGFVSEFVGSDNGNESRRMRGEATVRTPAGTTLVIAGEASTDHVLSPPTWSSSVDGVMNYDGPASHGTWIEEGADVAMEYTLIADDNGQMINATLDGSVAGFTGEVSAVAFTDAYFSAEPDYPCPQEPSGSLALRDTNGVWTDLVFDVTGSALDGWAIEDGMCDGCGTLWYDGETLGQVCIDDGPILYAETPPW